MNIPGMALFILTWRADLTTHTQKINFITQVNEYFYFLPVFTESGGGTEYYSPSHSRYRVPALGSSALLAVGIFFSNPSERQ